MRKRPNVNLEAETRRRSTSPELVDQGSENLENGLDDGSIPGDSTNRVDSSTPSRCNGFDSHLDLRESFSDNIGSLAQGGCEILEDELAQNSRQEKSTYSGVAFESLRSRCNADHHIAILSGDPG